MTCKAHQSFLVALLLLASFVTTGFASAEELRNDDWENGNQLGFQSGFISGEIGAVRLVPTIPGSWPLQNIQLIFGGSTSIQSVILHIWDDSPQSNNPGAEIYSETYQLQGSDDAMNQIDLSSQGIIVSGPIRIGIEFTHSGTPSIARDFDGTINETRNFIKTGGVWYQSNLLGLVGDWVIRANTNTNANSYLVGGNVTGLAGSLTLQNNGGDTLIVTQDGPFTFLTALNDGDAYNVVVTSEPAGQTCSIGNGSGTINGTNVSDVSVNCSGGSGGTQILANDNFVDGDEAGFQGGFAIGEIAASRLTAPGPDSWSLDLIQFLFGGAETQQTVTLKIWEENGDNLPGVEIFSSDYLVLGGDALQQIDLSAEGLNVSGDFRVGLQLQHAGFPSVARDSDGITPDRNFIFINAGSWHEAGSLGISGDWIIRAQVSQEQVAEPFLIASINDFPNDQGKQVRLTWPNSSFDAPGSSSPVTGYALFRRIDPELKSYPEGDWDYLRTIPAFQETSYSTIVPTAADSTIVNGMYYSSFFVRAMTASPGVYFDSAPDSGYSVDNLVPQTPQGLVVAYNASGGNNLSWQDNTDSDFNYFKIYRGLTADFTIDPNNPTYTTTGTNWQDFNSSFEYFYRISAVDFSGNESPVTETADNQVSGVEEGSLPQVTTLNPVFPNPFNPRTSISFAMTSAGKARISVYDISGRLVQTILDQNLGRGTHEVIWQGKDDLGRAQASGIFFVRLETNGYVGTQRMILVR